MLDPNLLRSEPDAVAEKLIRRGPKLDIDKLSALEEHRKVLQAKTENLRAERNSRSESIGQAKARRENIGPLHLEANRLGEEPDVAKAELNALQAEIRDIALTIPNLSADEVPVDKDGNNSVEASHWGTPYESDSEVRDHVTLGGVHSGLGFAAIVRLVGSRFVIMKGQIVRMHCVLSQFTLDLHTERHGYNENYVPYLVNQDMLYGTDQLPEFTGDLFHTRPLEEETDTSNYMLVPTTEVSLVNLVRDETIDEDDLSIRIIAYIPCLHSKAGSHGCGTRGLIRVHQFDKVEMVQVVRPEDSMATLEEMTGHTEEVLQLLDSPYHKIILCIGDMGFSACKTYDLKVWISVQNTYREISSCSNVWDSQVCRIQARCRSKSDKRTCLTHTLNGSGLAVSRMLATVMENYQQANGHIEVPEVLCPYMSRLEYIG